MLSIGCHLSTTKGYTAMGETALSIGANTFAFFTRNPRGGNAKALDPADVAGLREILDQHGFATLVAHAPYTYNPCSAKESAREFALGAMAEDLQRMEMLPGQYYNFHPGSHVGQGAQRGIELIVETLCQVMFEGQSTCVLLETMAGKGTEVGRSFEEVAAIIQGVVSRRPELDGCLGVCMDSCHVSDAGYDIIHDWTAFWTSSTAWSALTACAPCTSTIPRTLAALIRTATRSSVRATLAARTLVAAWTCSNAS